MPHYDFGRAGWALPLTLALGVALLASSATYGQDDDRLNLPADKFKSTEFPDLVEGRRPVVVQGDEEQTKRNRECLDYNAMKLTYRLTHTEYHNYDPTLPVRTMSNLVREALSRILPQPSGKPLNANQEVYMDEFSKRLVPHLTKVMQNQRPIVLVNAARILARLGEVGREEAADLLQDIVKDPKYKDEVRLYALKGLTGLFAAGTPEKSVFKDREKENACILALHKFLERKSPVPANAPKEEQDAVHFVRREGVRALAHTRYPVVLDKDNKPLLDKDGKLAGPTAIVLARYLRQDPAAPAPEPSLTERLEAALGLCQLQPKLFKDYQTDVAAYHVGCLLVDLADTYNREALGKKEGAEDVPMIGWRYNSVRMALGLAQLKASAAKSPGEKFIGQIADQAQPILEVMKKFDRTTTANSNDYVQMLKNNKPAEQALYKGMADSAIKAPEPGEK